MRETLRTSAGRSKGGDDAVVVPIAIPRELLTITAAPPAFISQKTSLAVVGITARTFLEMIRAPGFPLAVTPVGKHRLVVTADFVAHLKTLGATAPPAARATTTRPANDHDDQEVDELAAELLGRRPAAAARAR